MIQTLSIIIPVYNEEKTIEKILIRVISVEIPVNKEIICIDDGSRDSSGAIIQKVIAQYPQMNISYFQKENGGKGSAVREGIEKANGDLLIIQDADLEYDPTDYIRLIQRSSPGIVVYGSRYLSEKGHLKENNHITFKIHKAGNRFLSLMTSALYGARITDMETCYKLLPKEVYKRLHLYSNNFDIEPEMTAKILKAGFKIVEVPINYYSRDFNEGKKITWKDGMKAFFCLIKYRFMD